MDPLPEISEPVLELNSPAPAATTAFAPLMLKPSHLVDHLDKFIVGQEEAKRQLATTLINHMCIVNHNVSRSPESIFIDKNNVILTGPSGSGKTYMVDLACKYLGVPFINVDITQYSATGYKGREVSEIESDIFAAAGHDVKKVPYAVVFVDEVDKIATTSKGENAHYDRMVQYSLLKLVEGQHFPDVDTRNILYIFAGSFDIIRREEEQEQGKRSIGFGAAEPEIKDPAARKYQSEDFIKVGLIRELVGRIGQIINLNPLTETDLEKIITEPANSIKKQYEELFKIRNINKAISQADIKAIVKETKDKGLGARGLKSVAAKHFAMSMYE